VWRTGVRAVTQQDAGHLAADLVIDRVTRRLVVMGAAAELAILARLSAQEVDELVWQERHA
jgi:hypothetical protein